MGAPCLDTAQIALYRLRIIIAGKLAGAWDQWGGLVARLRHSTGHLDACVENNMEDTALSTDAEMDAPARTTRGRADFQGTLRVVAEPGRYR